MTPFEPFDEPHPVIGMVHLPALPGAPGHDSSRASIRERAVAAATALLEGGVDGILVENFGDAPFYPASVPTHVVADLTAITATVVESVDVPVGVNVLRNDAEAAVSVAAAAGATFVRVNVHVGAAVTDQGLLEGRAHETMRLRERIDAPVAVFADVHVKHASPLGTATVEQAARDATDRGLADGIVVSGPSTGSTTSVGTVERVSAALESGGESTPVIVGSGVTPATVASLTGAGADGFIVGTALKQDGRVDGPISVERVSRLVDARDTVDARE